MFPLEQISLTLISSSRQKYAMSIFSRLNLTTTTHFIFSYKDYFTSLQLPEGKPLTKATLVLAEV
jgi:hypothetical protein